MQNFKLGKPQMEKPNVEVDNSPNTTIWDIPRFLHGYTKIHLIQSGTHENYHGHVTCQHRPNMTATMTKPKDKMQYSIGTERNQGGKYTAERFKNNGK
jgi:hypothetical protein